MRVIYQLGNEFAEIEYPCTDEELDNGLSELTHYSYPSDLFVKEVIEPRELAFLENTFVNPDEINYLTKRMDSFWGDEEIQFYEAANYRAFTEPKDLINLTFNLQKYPIIRDISDLENVGRNYLLNIQGSIPAHDEGNPKYAKLGRELLSSGKGIVTENGLLFDEPEIEYEEIYDGQVFPPYYYDSSMLATIRADFDGKSEYLYLPCEPISIRKSISRLGAAGSQFVEFSVEDTMFESDEWNYRIADVLRNDGVRKLNAFLQFLSKDGFDYDKMNAVANYAGVTDGESLIHLARNIDRFIFAEDVSSYYEVGAYMCSQDEDFHLPSRLDEYFDFAKYGRRMCEVRNGKFVPEGFVCLDGTMSLDDILPDNENTMQLGGM